MVADIAQATVDQVDTFLEQHPNSCRNDCADSLWTLKQLAKAANNYAQELAEKESRAMARRQMEMADLSIAESRSAIGCECIASQNAISVPRSDEASQ